MNSSDINLKQLAQQLGVSKATVSRALNGYPEVNADTRRRVLEAAHAAGYRPNSLARSLAVGRTDMIGLVYPLRPNDLGNPFFLSVVSGIEQALRAQGKSLLIAAEPEEDQLAPYQQWVRSGRLDGLIVPQTRINDVRFDFLRTSNMPFIAHGRFNTDQGYAWFDYDNEAGVALAVERLAQLGHQRIALISAQQQMSCHVQRRQGFMHGMRAHDLPVLPGYMLSDVTTPEQGEAATHQLLALTPRPTAIVVDNNMAAVGVVHALQSVGIQLGRDLSLIIHDEIPYLNWFVGPITSVVLPKPVDAGAKIAELLLKRMDGQPVEQLQVLWQPALVIGASDGPPPT
ncbi:LacI family DNA-binding transcriptional regulator [Chitinivorax sp. B]|uniref:LacI family DNA-binding transcriptional regulator n=1 Tax=Chitinivorax sp. B TaxID=2502235 RepID=UPI002017BA7E|nr:LacI family DNA-binding transcriptional regulator [Chitinivorax sp. B]